MHCQAHAPSSILLKIIYCWCGSAAAATADDDNDDSRHDNEAARLKMGSHWMSHDWRGQLREASTRSMNFCSDRGTQVGIWNYACIHSSYRVITVISLEKSCIIAVHWLRADSGTKVDIKDGQLTSRRRWRPLFRITYPEEPSRPCVEEVLLIELIEQSLGVCVTVGVFLKLEKKRRKN